MLNTRYICSHGVPLLLLNQTEQRRGGEQIVLYHVQRVDEVQHFGLSSSAAMHHAVNAASVQVENLLDDRQIGARRGEHELSGVQRGCPPRGRSGGRSRNIRAARESCRRNSRETLRPKSARIRRGGPR